MGFNTENLFVRSGTSDVVVAAVEEYLQNPTQPPGGLGTWPLEVTFHPSRAARGRKVSISDPARGWVAVVDSSETVEPALAAYLAHRLGTRVVAAQVYEVTGSAGSAICERGTARGGPTHHDVDDPVGDIKMALAKEGIPFGPLLFKDTIGRGVVGWRTVCQPNPERPLHIPR